MINTTNLKAAVAAMPGDVIAVQRSQFAELIAELEVGQHARRALTNLKSITAIAASSAGAPA